MKYAASFKATEFFRHDGAGRYPINTYWRAYQRGNFDYWRCRVYWIAYLGSAAGAAGYKGRRFRQFIRRVPRTCAGRDGADRRGYLRSRKAGHRF